MSLGAVEDEIEAAVQSSPSPGSIQGSALKLRHKIGFSLGHVLNDLCASMWFTYLLIYFNYVKGFGPTMAGELLLVGQVADGLATPFVGLESDRDSGIWFCGRYGRRKSWHLAGTIAVLGSFPFIFTECTWCKGAGDWSQFFYYSVFVVIFQFGWASVQVAHLSMIPDLTEDTEERTSLNASRYAFTVLSNIFVYVITWIVLESNLTDANSHLSPSDDISFQMVTIIIICLGALLSIIFHILVPDPTKDVTHHDPTISAMSESFIDKSLHLNWRDWFIETQFYIIGLNYMATRLYSNLAQVFISLYLQKTLLLPKRSIAIIPLTMYVSGFLASYPINVLSKKLQLKTFNAIGGVLAILGSVWIAMFDQTNLFNTYEIYGVATVIGVASSILLITSVSITNEMIGCSSSSGAFVYGAMSFLDKVSNGVVVMVIESLHDCQSCHQIDEKDYYHYVMSYALGGAAVISLLSLLMLHNSKATERRSDLIRRSGMSSRNGSASALINEDEGPSERTRLLN